MNWNWYQLKQILYTRTLKPFFQTFNANTNCISSEKIQIFSVDAFCDV